MHTNEPPVPPRLVCTKKVFDFSDCPFIMGIVNVTPDSFSDGGMCLDKAAAVARGLELARQGADIIDIGGESTRPGAASVAAAEELARVIPVIEELAGRVDIPLSIDTTKAEVARKALAAGAEIVNDISALRCDPDMAALVADSAVPVVLMHMRGTPRTMQHDIQYDSLIEDIYGFLEERIHFAVAAGIEHDKIIIDPGLGFGKSIGKDNFTILNRLDRFALLGKAILIGPSRKAFIGKLLQKKEATERDEGTAAAVALAVYKGAHIVRVHNVAVMKTAARVADAVRRS
jgi:dihydropteroate synthase